MRDDVRGRVRPFVVKTETPKDIRVNEGGMQFDYESDNMLFAWMMYPRFVQISGGETLPSLPRVPCNAGVGSRGIDRVAPVVHRVGGISDETHSRGARVRAPASPPQSGLDPKPSLSRFKDRSVSRWGGE
jgi:hypothetical protein